MSYLNQTEPQLLAPGGPLEVTTTVGSTTFSGLATLQETVNSPVGSTTFDAPAPTIQEVVTPNAGTVTYSGLATVSGKQNVVIDAAGTATFAAYATLAFNVSTSPGSATFDALAPGISEVTTVSPATVTFSGLAFVPITLRTSAGSVTFGSGNITVNFVVVEKDGKASLEIKRFGATLDIIPQKSTVTIS